jgi:endo-1,4-beta-D-glucanase Y
MDKAMTPPPKRLKTTRRSLASRLDALRTRSASRLLIVLAVAVLYLSQEGHAQQPWPLWESYAGHIIDQQGRVIDHTAQDHTTSEGQAYGMFFALVANDRTRFDKIFRWTETNLAAGDLTLRLPSWSWGKGPDGSWRALDPNPASDADLWIAYDLMEAGRLWQEPRYRKLGTLMAMRIAQQEVVYVPGLGTTLLSGTVGFHPNPSTWLLNPSYLPPFVLAYFAKAIPTGPWRAVLDSLQPLLAQGSGAGYAMDWVSAGTVIRPSLSPTELAAGVNDKLPIGSYDAIRVYLWLGISDPATPGVQALLPRVSGMATYLKMHVTPPEQVDSLGRVLSTNAPPGFSAALIPYLHALGLKAPEKLQIERLAATFDTAQALYGHNAAYYDQNLALFSTGWTEQRYRFDRDGSLKVKWQGKQ